jgi:flagellar biosynthetic protein FliS
MDVDAMSLVPDPAILPAQSEPRAIPEHVVILLLEAAQGFLGRIEEAIGSGEPMLKEHFTNKVLAILEELHARLNHEQGGELVANLISLYAWWRQEVIDAGDRGDIGRLDRVTAQMRDIRGAWEHVLFQGEGMSESPKI